MKKMLYTNLFCLLLLVSSMSTALAKGPADKITISGPGLSEPIEITDARILEKFSPWGEAFFDERQGFLAESPVVDASYQVQFFMRDQGGELRLSYIFEYAPGDPGYIHLPGKGDKDYEINKGTIMRREDGGWLYASEGWYDLMRNLLGDQEIFAAARSLQSDEAVKAADIRSGPESDSPPAPRSGDAGRSPLIWLGVGTAIVLAGVLLRILSPGSKGG